MEGGLGGSAGIGVGAGVGAGAPSPGDGEVAVEVSVLCVYFAIVSGKYVQYVSIVSVDCAPYASHGAEQAFGEAKPRGLQYHI